MAVDLVDLNRLNLAELVVDPEQARILAVDVVEMVDVAEMAVAAAEMVVEVYFLELQWKL
jgi:hypothetical protein